MMSGKVKEILIAKKAGEALVSRLTADLKVGKGIVGDRYYSSEGTFSKKLEGKPDFEVTLIEQEEIDSFNKITGNNYIGRDFRRNIVTVGIRLNDLVGREFFISGVKLEGIRLCEPCAYLSGFLGNKIMELMVHKAGLRARIIEGGNIEVSSEIRS